jgi:glycosyltransferase involved in cell wall biosynthesis
MKVLVLTWEFPPRLVGGISRHAGELYPELVKLGHQIHLITVEFGEAPRYEVVAGIAVHRVGVAAGDNFFHWIANMNESMGAHAGKLLAELGNFDLIHTHDWLVGDAAIALAQKFQIPLVTTIHATEFGRYNGIYTSDQAYINQKEKLLAQEAWRVIVCTDYMRREVERTLGVDWNKIEVVYNGICPEKKQLPPHFDRAQFRRKFADDSEKIVYYVGRLTHEKGVSVLIHAAPKVIEAMGNQVKFVIIGSGNSDDLKRQVWELGVWQKFYFTGFMSDHDLDKFQTIADCAVFPSLYEPFGIVALESFAARVPVVVSDTGGLPEVVRHNRTGVITWTNQPDSLSWGILEVLQRPDYAQRLVENAYLDLSRRFAWGSLARQTEAVYGRVLHGQTRRSTGED